jgi:hypothetical protein
LGPGVRSDQVEFVAGPTTDGAWLFAKDDCLVTKVNGAGATLVLTSVRGPGGETLSIKVERLDARVEAPAAAPSAVAPPLAMAPAVAKPANGHTKAAPSPKASKTPVFAAADGSSPLPVDISAHIRTRGDMTFSEVPWAGRVAPGLWIESFSVKPVQRFAAQDVEYKGLTGSGFETPWCSDATMCGTRGMAVPLVGFAIRLKPSKQTAAFDCEYSGYFKSGATVGPLRNGAPCRSTVANDPLEGIQVHIRKRTSATLPADRAPGTVKMQSGVPPALPTGPSFGRYRDVNGHDANARAAAAPKTPAPLTSSPASKPAVKSGRKSNGSAAHSKRPPARRP